MVLGCFCAASSTAQDQAEQRRPPKERPAAGRKKAKNSEKQKKRKMLSRLIEGIVHLVEDDDDFTTASEGGSPTAQPAAEDSGHLTAGPSGSFSRPGMDRRPSSGRSSEPSWAAAAAAATTAAAASGAGQQQQPEQWQRPLASPGGAVRQQRPASSDGGGGVQGQEGQQQRLEQGYDEEDEDDREEEEGEGEGHAHGSGQRRGWSILGGVPFLPKIVELLTPKASETEEAEGGAAAGGRGAADGGHLQPPASPGGTSLYPTVVDGSEAQPRADDEDLQGTTTEPAPLAAGQQPLPQLSEPSQLMSEDHIRALSAAVPARYRQARWTLLYSTGRDGISLQTLVRNAQKRAPTVLVVRDFDRHVFGAYCSESWKLDKHFFGTGETFVFQLHPRPAVWYWWWRRMAKEHNDYFQWLSAEAIAVGGSGGYALWLDSDLSSGISRNSTTFGNDSLAGSEDFRVGAVELWGLS